MNLLDIQLPLGESAASYIQSIFDREMGVTLSNAIAGSSRDDAMRELTRTTAGLYAKRVLRELIQNAFDGASKVGDARIVVRLDMNHGDHGTLYVANTGEGFTESNVDAIANPALSNKRPGNFIGHKGLGFRSVELLSDEVQIFSVAGEGRNGGTFDGFCFQFATAVDERNWLDGHGASEHAGKVVGRAHRLQLPVPIIDIPPHVRDFAAAGFATLVRLPLRDESAATRAAEELTLLLEEDTSLTLFLDRLSSLTLERIPVEGKTVSKVLTRTARNQRSVSRGRGLTMQTVSVDRRRYLMASMPVDDDAFRESVAKAVAQRHPVEKWLEWKGAPAVSIAIPLSADAKAGNYFAFLPMDTVSPFNGYLDAPFYPDPDRRDLDLGNPLNGFLLDSVAELCLAVAEELADANEADVEMAAAAVDALCWYGDPDRLIEAAGRLGSEIGALRFPSMRRKEDASRWARLDVIFDWDDVDKRYLTAGRLVRVCNIPMLRRNLGSSRLKALHDFVDATEFGLFPAASNWTEWAPALAEDLRSKAKKVLLDWDDFYADLADLSGVLPHLRGTTIFVNEAGKLVAANSPETLAQREFYIRPALSSVAGRRIRKVAGTASFPPNSVAKNMEFADPALLWPVIVTKAFFDAGLATEFSLPKVIEGIGRFSGQRPTKQVLLAVLRWTFSAWSANRTPEVEAALRKGKFKVPPAEGNYQFATQLRFGRGWRDTQGDLLADFVDNAHSVSRAVANMQGLLLPSWDKWPLKEHGTAADWTVFLRAIGVRDGIVTNWYKAIEYHVDVWRGWVAGSNSQLPIESSLGGIWREAVRNAPDRQGFSYQSGHYSTDATLTAFPGQADHTKFSDVAKLAYARLIANCISSIPTDSLSTVLRRTSGNYDTARWPSPLLGFLREAEWVPVLIHDAIVWRRPRDCWYSPRTDPLPRFVPKIDRSIRDLLDASAQTRDFFSKRLGMRVWLETSTAIARLEHLGEMLQAGTVPESEQDSFRKAHRDAWIDWSKGEPKLVLPTSLVLAVQSGGQFVPFVTGGGPEETGVFIGDGEDQAVEGLLVSLGHPLLPAPTGSAQAMQEALSKTLASSRFELVSTTKPTILIDGAEFDPSTASRLVGDGREWLAELGVLVLEFNQGFTNRNTARTRQSLFEAFGRLHVKFANEVAVRIEGKTGDLPHELDGVLAVPHGDRPTLIVQSQSTSLDWPTLARLSRGIAPAVDRAWLHTDMRMVFQAIAAMHPQIGGGLEQPNDEVIARAIGQPIHRVREVLRSLRSTSRRLFDFLVPAAVVRWGSEVAYLLLDGESKFLEDQDIVTALSATGVDPAEARQVLLLCREADSIDDLRRAMNVDLPTFNIALVELGLPWKPLNFEGRIRDGFASRIAERRNALEQRVRDAFLKDFDDQKDLSRYAEERRLSWLDIDMGWITARDTLENQLIDDYCNDQFDKRYGQQIDRDDLVSIETTRQYNRTKLVESGEMLRKLVSAWHAKNPQRGTMPDAWRGNVEQIARDAMATGAMDFRRTDREQLPVLLGVAGIWPQSMPRSVDLAALDLKEDDLQVQARREQENREAAAKLRRTVTIGTTSIDGGLEGAFQAAATALEASLSGDAFLSRSGPANLRRFPAQDGSGRSRSGSRSGGKDPEYMSDERRGLIGFAGEYAAYRYLKKNVRNFSDEHWISSMGRRYLALAVRQDEDGYDFEVPRTRGNLYYEVKAHEGDPGHVDLERSQVAAAVSYADEKKGRWHILYVAYATNPDRVTVYELPNPFSKNGLDLFRPSTRQGVRLLIEHEDEFLK
ncbi:ATP-binding protein [Mesorhizobium shangrilense]|uniref:ATP-binding protein n=1 Tax=Mesorhizobium shangrilense TaxID=460060 RepID=A0ABV2DLN1_9HYPH